MRFIYSQNIPSRKGERSVAEFLLRHYPFAIRADENGINRLSVCVSHVPISVAVFKKNARKNFAFQFFSLVNGVFAYRRKRRVYRLAVFANAFRKD